MFSEELSGFCRYAPVFASGQADELPQEPALNWHGGIFQLANERTKNRMDLAGGGTLPDQGRTGPLTGFGPHTCPWLPQEAGKGELTPLPQTTRSYRAEHFPPWLPAWPIGDT